MTRGIIDLATLSRLRNAHDAVEIFDDSSNAVRHFVPTARPETGPLTRPQISEEELDRRQQTGAGCPLADLLRDLEKRA